jgi:hypothetical protein
LNEQILESFFKITHSFILGIILGYALITVTRKEISVAKEVQDLIGICRKLIGSSDHGMHARLRMSFWEGSGNIKHNEEGGMLWIHKWAKE